MASPLLALIDEYATAASRARTTQGHDRVAELRQRIARWRRR